MVLACLVRAIQMTSTSIDMCIARQVGTFSDKRRHPRSQLMTDLFRGRQEDPEEQAHD